MDNAWINGLLGGLAAMVVIPWYLKKLQSKQTHGKLRYGLAIKVLGGVCLLGCVIPLYFFITQNYDTETPSETYALIGLILGCGAIAYFLIRESFEVQGDFDEQGLRFKHPWGLDTQQQWCDLQRITLNRLKGCHELYFQDGTRVTMSVYLLGLQELEQELHKHGFKLEKPYG